MSITHSCVVLPRLPIQLQIFLVIFIFIKYVTVDKILIFYILRHLCGSVGDDIRKIYESLSKLTTTTEQNSIMITSISENSTKFDQDIIIKRSASLPEFPIVDLEQFNLLEQLLEKDESGERNYSVSTAFSKNTNT